MTLPPLSFLIMFCNDCRPTLLQLGGFIDYGQTFGVVPCFTPRLRVWPLFRRAYNASSGGSPGGGFCGSG